MYLVLKALLSGAIVVAASEVARRSSILGAIIVSLPLTSILAMIWLYRDTGDDREVSDLSWAILWVFAPSLVTGAHPEMLDDLGRTALDFLAHRRPVEPERIATLFGSEETI